MSNEQEMREAFEEKFPVPALIEWNDTRGEYWPTHDDTKWWGHTVANAHNMRLAAWQAATLAAEARIRELEAVANEYYDLIKHINSGGDFDEFVNGRSFAALTESNFSSSLERQYKENQG